MSDEWDGCEMVCRVIRKADLIEYLDESRSLLRGYYLATVYESPPAQAAALAALKARSLVEDATTFLRALGAEESA